MSEAEGLGVIRCRHMKYQPYIQVSTAIGIMKTRLPNHVDDLLGAEFHRGIDQIDPHMPALNEGIGTAQRVTTNAL